LACGRQVLIFRRITNREYQGLTGANRQTALRDLRELISHGIVVQMVATGRGAYYRLT
jgi:Fic family protein